MGWDRRGYYYRARKVNGRVVRDYVGYGPVAALAEEMDAIDRQDREMQWAAEKAERGRLEALDGPVEELNELVERLASAALLAAGFHQHKRGEWRKRRGRSKEAG